MPPKRKAKSTAQKILKTESDSDGLSHEDLFNVTFDLESDEEDNSDHSDWGSKRKPKRKKAKLTRRSKPEKPAPLLDLSDEDYDAEPRLGSPELVRPAEERSANPHPKVALTKDTAQTVPNVLQIHVNTTTKGPAVINLDLAAILTKWGKDKSIADGPGQLEDDTTLVEDVPSTPAKARRKVTRSARKRRGKPTVGFMDLPYEIRSRIYRQTFVTDSPIDFASRADFARSAAFLRTCSGVHEEGRAILYGENAFHFERTPRLRGNFYNKEWKEIGFKDVRRFLETIGDANISQLKYVSFALFDAGPGLTPELEEAERRFANDPVLHRVLDLIGHNAVLSKLAIAFAGRRAVTAADFHFLRCLTGLKCHEFMHGAIIGYHHSKIKPELVSKIKKMMVIKRSNDDIDVTRKKDPMAKMFQQKPVPYNQYVSRWY